MIVFVFKMVTKEVHLDQSSTIVCTVNDQFDEYQPDLVALLYKALNFTCKSRRWGNRQSGEGVIEVGEGREGVVCGGQKVERLNR